MKILLIIIIVFCIFIFTACDQKVCCQSLDPSCVACNQGITKEKFCKINQDYPGCEKPKACCKALTAECLACSEDISVDKYCNQNPNTSGC
jgi:hypothetical protein